MRRKLLCKAWTDRDHFLSPLKLYISECVLTHQDTGHTPQTTEDRSCFHPAESELK